ncbi:hypothetical protein [Streptomyces sp. AMCC400023]|uniref:hypothetical protein n=1 Tax=Streptomyces sp. AMCC400023 TaxID=2056258 RepID=UPI001F377A87|nr:hypothetical protein [Streptomyces sp. AMCC400023]UJV42039.1 hypothetical protein CVT30_21295 [Streptomyces sp. AMCC400023]
MAWFALDDGFDTHPKVRKAGNAAVGLFVRLGVHATKHLTEGHLDGDIVRDYGTAATIRKLIAVGMLHESGHGCLRCPQPGEGNFFIHDYLDYNKSRAQIEAAREAARKRQNRGRETARANRSARDSERILRSNSRQNGAGFDSNSRQNAPLFEDEPAGQEDLSRRDTHEGATVVPSPPLPSHNYDVADLGGGSTRSRARAAEPDGPSPIDIDGFELTDAMRGWALRTFGAGLDLDYETAQFVDHFRAQNTQRPNWPTEWQKWVRRSAKYASERANRPAGIVVPFTQSRPSTTDARVQAALDLGRQMQAEYDAAHKEAQ